jgi:eukaryotic-like serine/threonine-protein kinase
MHDPTRSERFDIIRCLGSGGMGVVYEAQDQQRDRRVALKTVRNLNASLLYRFKKEFRALADLSHPNLVTLYELISEQGSWFYTMELVDGVTFLHHVRPGAGGEESSTEVPTLDWEEVDTPVELAAEGSPYLPDRLRNGMQQLAQGIHFLHSAGKVHRDIKPANVMVTGSGRVVLMDFGIVFEISQEEVQSTGAGVVGTAAYMAPEQAAGEQVSAASDWYSVGVILYQALTGRLPFTGVPLQVLLAKQQRDPIRPAEYIGDVDADLERLCVDLLRQRPEDRPEGVEVLRRLGVEVDEDSGTAEESMTLTGAPVFVGRHDELELLGEAFDRLDQRRGTGVFVTGASGMGKSRLVKHFLSEVRRLADPTSPAPLILSGRCYQRETVPYKAFDSIVDALSHVLVAMDRAELDEMLPQGSAVLGRLFPVLKRVPGIGGRNRPLGVPDPQELRSRGFLALKTLFARLARQRPLILFIDDLQWADHDSVELLEDLMRPPTPLTAFLLACYRDDHLDERSPLAELLADLQHRDRIQRLDLQPLGTEDALQLAASILGRSVRDMPIGQSIRDEAAGNPFFVGEICRYVQTRRDRADLDTGVDLDRALEARIDGLDPVTAELMRLLAVAGEPIPAAVIARALDLAPDRAEGLVGVLRASSLTRRITVRDQLCVEVYHDRLRQVLLQGIDDEQRRELHRRLAPALESWDDVPVESLATHWRRAGQPHRAIDHARAAAREAETNLAFGRAARLYEGAIQLVDSRSDDAREMTRALGDCLVNAGRLPDAARAYLRAAEGANREQGHELRRLGTEQLLLSGQLEEGMLSTASVLGEIGVKLPTTTRRAFFSMLFHRLLVRLRGLRWTDRDPNEIPGWDLIRCDTLWTLARALAVTQPILASLFSWRSLRMALRIGEPGRVAGMLLGTGAQMSMLGMKQIRRAEHHIERALVPVHKLGAPRLLAVEAMCRGIVAFNAGRWHEAVDRCSAAETIFTEQCQGTWNNVATARQHLLMGLVYLGQLDEVARRVERYLRDARLRRDLYTEGNVRSRFSLVWLALDDPDRAVVDLTAALGSWPGDRFTGQHDWAMTSLTEAHLYRGDVHAAGQVFDRLFPLYQASTFRYMHIARCEKTLLEGRISLARAAAGFDRDGNLARATRCARDLRREQVGFAPAWGQLIEAGIAHLGDDIDRASELLSEVDIRLEAADMHLVAAAARRRYGALVGGADGGRRIEDADRWMASVQIRDPIRMTAMLIPGFDT